MGGRKSGFFFTGKIDGNPVEYVYGVIEVKAAFNTKSVKQAVEQLRKLRPLMGFRQPSIHDYRFYLPKNFFCATVFYELHKENETDFGALDAFLMAPT